MLNHFLPSNHLPENHFLKLQNTSTQKKNVPSNLVKNRWWDNFFLGSLLGAKISVNSKKRGSSKCSTPTDAYLPPTDACLPLLMLVYSCWRLFTPTGACLAYWRLFTPTSACLSLLALVHPYWHLFTASVQNVNTCEKIVGIILHASHFVTHEWMIIRYDMKRQKYQFFPRLRRHEMSLRGS